MFNRVVTNQTKTMVLLMVVFTTVILIFGDEGLCDGGLSCEFIIPN